MTLARTWLPGLVLLLASGCTFQGGGLAPFNPAPPAAIAEARLEIPYVPTPRPAVDAMLDMASVGPDDYLIDLGSGDGRIPIMAAQRGARALGVDIDPERVAQAAAAARIAQVETRATFRRQDLFDTPIREASVVTLYLLPEINLRLRPRLLTELRPGTRVVSHQFGLGDWQPDDRREIGASTLYLWIVPAVVAGSWSLEIEGRPAMPLMLEQSFQQATGRAGVQRLRDVALRGRRLSFTLDLPGGPRTFDGIVADDMISPDPASATRDWRARRID